MLATNRKNARPSLAPTGGVAAIPIALRIATGLATRLAARLSMGLATGLAIELAIGLGGWAGARPALAQQDAGGRVDASARGGGAPLRVLVFSRTDGYRHDSIETGIAALREIGAEHGFEIVATEEPGAFADSTLSRFDVVAFLSTTGDVLDPPEEGALERFVRGGGGWVGIHAATDTEYGWDWYGRLSGARFASHPRIQSADVLVLDPHHPSTEGLPRRWTRTDEWYDFRASPAGDVHVLARLDETTYQGGQMGHDHPIAWCHEFDGGRAWYTGGGHTKESFAEPEFRRHLAGGILWAAGAATGDAGASREAFWDKVVLDDFVTDPMELAVLPDGRVLFVERQGIVKIWDPKYGRSVIAGFVEVFDELEDGLLGTAIDPSFEETGWFWVYYSPLEGEPRNRLSRLTLEGNAFDPASEVVVLEIPTQRDECCHAGGSIAFDDAGCLWLSTGDNTSPFASSGYAPIDERPGREPFDAQKSSASTDDLRGKVLRIRPLPEGGYAIPEGNLFPQDGSNGEGRPEIFAMGCRNPFRIGVDRRRGWVYWGEVGPDASRGSDERGPAGHDEFNQARVAGNYGWPYFVGENHAYADHDFDSGESGDFFDPAAPVNESKNRNGRRELPPAIPAWIAYTYDETPGVEVLGSGGRCAMAGPVFRAADVGDHPSRVPDAFDESVFLYEWSRNALYVARLESDGDLLSLDPFLPSFEFLRPHDLELGPDGRLYMIEWGTGFGGGNDDAKIVRLDYHRSGRRPPKARVTADRTSGPTPLEVTLDATASATRASAPGLSFAWDLDGDGQADDAEGATLSHVFEAPGVHDVVCHVTDADGTSSRAAVTITAGNTRPDVRFDWPPDGGVVALGDTVEYRVTVTDAEDAPAREGNSGAGEATPAKAVPAKAVPAKAVSADRVDVQPYLGHDTHAHPLHRSAGVAGRVETLRDEGHGADANLFTVLAADYEDRGAPGAPSLDGRAEVVLQPRRKQAEFAGELRDARIEKSDGGAAIVFEGDRASASFEPMHFAGVEAVRLRVAPGPTGARVELREDSPAGPTLGRTTIEGAGGVQLHPTEPVAVRVEMFERSGGAGVILRAEGPGVPRAPVPADWWVDGVRARFYAIEDLDEQDALPDFAKLDADEATRAYGETRVDTIDFPSTDGELAGSGRDDDFAIVFEGELRVPVAGPWSFTLESDDGSRLLLDDELLIDNDGLHGMVEKSPGPDWRDVTIPVEDPGRTFTLWVVVHPARGHDTATVRVDWLEFVGPGAVRPVGEMAR